MIFVTVGTQLPFDRLVSAMDRWAAENPQHPVVAQVGGSQCSYAHLDVRPWVDGAEYDNLVVRADLVVAHAGIGAVLTARAHSVPILVLPRRAKLGEHRDDHQVESARRFEALGIVPVAWSESELSGAIARLMFNGEVQEEHASSRAGLVSRVRALVHAGLSSDVQ